MHVSFPITGNTSVGSYGWTCQQCGSWVPSGCGHACSGAARWMNPPPPPVYDRIAAALERIADRLEGKSDG